MNSKKINRKELKNKGKTTLKRSYFRVVFICLISIVFINVGFDVANPLSSFMNNNVVENEIVDEYVFNYGDSPATIKDKKIMILSNNPIWEYLDQYKPTKGALSHVYNNVVSSNSLTFGIINVISEITNNNFGLSSIALIISIILAIVIQILFKNMFIIGKTRFFLENRKYKDTTYKAVLFPFYLKKGYKSGITMFVKSIYQSLWNLTVVGGVIKYYSYYLVPYILAENPTLSSKKAINLSKKMMFGYKYQAFKFDVSFILYEILGILSFSVLSILYVTPYIESSRAELYIVIRDYYIKNDMYVENFIDENLNNEIVEESYNMDDYPLEYNKIKNKGLNYKSYYTKYSIAFMFLIFCIIGYLWEVSLEVYKCGKFINRGTLHGPWLPIYGVGAVIMILITRKSQESLIKTFGLCFISSGILEFYTAALLWNVHGQKWWDYSDFFLNIDGRVCLEGLLVFATGGMLVIYIIAPLLDDFYQKYKKNLNKVIIILWIILLFDFAYSTLNPNVGTGITDFEPKIIKIQEKQ